MKYVKIALSVMAIILFTESICHAQKSKKEIINETIENLEEAKFLMRIDKVDRTYYVSGIMWKMIDSKQKEEAVTWFARHAGYILSDVDSEVGVTVKDNHSGKTLAEYSMWSGVDIK